jgi:hypothetical protein
MRRILRFAQDKNNQFSPLIWGLVTLENSQNTKYPLLIWDLEEELFGGKIELLINYE